MLCALVLFPAALAPAHARWRGPKSSAFFRSRTVALNARPSLYEQAQQARVDTYAEGTRDAEGAYVAPAPVPAPVPMQPPAPSPGATAEEMEAEFRAYSVAEQEATLYEYWRSQEVRAPHILLRCILATTRESQCHGPVARERQ